MEIQYGTSNFDRERGNLPELPVVNMFAEDAVTEGKPVLQSRPGLANASVSMGSGPIRQLFQVDGVLSNALIGVSGSNLYTGSTLVGAINGTGPVSIDGYENLVFTTAGEDLWKYDGTTLSAVAFPDAAATIKVVVGASRAIIIEKNTQTFFWSTPLTSTIDALSFSSAENSPDRLRDMLYVSDNLILFGAETVEFWPATDNADSPFLPLKGRVFQKGIKATGCATIFSTSFAWVTEDNEICVSRPDNVVSDSGLSRRIAASTTVSLWRFWLDSIEFLAVTHDSGTEVLSAGSQSWSVFSSTGLANWKAKHYTNGYFGSSIDGQLYQWGTDHADFGGVLERNFRAWAAIESGGIVANNVNLRTNPGQTPFLVAPYDNPVIEMRTSRDGGHTWTPYRSANLGRQGKYMTTVQWRGLGMFSAPGVLVDFRLTDPVPLRVSNVLGNEPYGGNNGV